MSSPAFVIYPPSVPGRIGAVVRDVSLGLMGGAATAAGLSLVLMMIFDSMDGSTRTYAIRDTLTAMIGVGAALVVLMIPFWTISSQAEMLGIVRAMHRGARETPDDVPVAFQRRMLDSLHYTRRRHLTGVIVTTVAIIAGAMVCIALFAAARTDGELAAAWIGVGVTLAFIVGGIIAIRTGRESGPRNLSFVRDSAEARAVWDRDAVDAASVAAARRLSMLTVVPVAAGAGIRKLSAAMLAGGFGIITLGSIIAVAAAARGEETGTTPPAGLVAGGTVLLIGVAVLLIASAVKAVSEFRRFAALNRAIRDVDARHERVATEDLDTLIGDKPLARSWARRLAGFSPAALLVVAVLANDLPPAAVLAFPVLFLLASIVVAVIAAVVGAGPARRACAAFGIGDGEVLSLDDTVMEDRSDPEHEYTPTPEAWAAYSGRSVDEVRQEIQDEKRERFDRTADSDEHSS